MKMAIKSFAFRLKFLFTSFWNQIKLGKRNMYVQYAWFSHNTKPTSHSHKKDKPLYGLLPGVKNQDHTVSCNLEDLLLRNKVLTCTQESSQV